MVIRRGNSRHSGRKTNAAGAREGESMRVRYTIFWGAKVFALLSCLFLANPASAAGAFDTTMAFPNLGLFPTSDIGFMLP